MSSVTCGFCSSAQSLSIRLGADETQLFPEWVTQECGGPYRDPAKVTGGLVLMRLRSLFYVMPYVVFNYGYSSNCMWLKCDSMLLKTCHTANVTTLFMFLQKFLIKTTKFRETNKFCMRVDAMNQAPCKCGGWYFNKITFHTLLITL